MLCRQGDPLSLYLFILEVEPLVLGIKNSDKIKDINVGERQVKIGQYTTFLFLNQRSILNKSSHIISLLYNFWGLLINMEKTQAVCFISDDPDVKTLPFLHIKG